MTIENCSCQSVNCDSLQQFLAKTRDSLIRRGPDASAEITVQSDNLTLTFQGTLLWLRGKSPTKQPLSSELGDLLLWNGDLYYYDQDVDEKHGLSDTEFLFNRLLEANSIEDDDQVTLVLSDLEGPGAFVFYSCRKQKIWFGRDFFGRHSLLWSHNDSSFILSSIGDADVEGFAFTEVPAQGVFAVSLSELFACDKPINLMPWEVKLKRDEDGQTLPEFVNVNTSCIKTIRPKSRVCLNRMPTSDKETHQVKSISDYLSRRENDKCVDDLIAVLKQAVKVRIAAQPPFCKNCLSMTFKNMDQNLDCRHSKLGILFSGGLDSVMLAALAASCVESGTSIDLLNVAFKQSDDSYEVPDRVTARQALTELNEAFPTVIFNLVLVNVTKEELQEERRSRIKRLLYPLQSVLDDSIGCAIWFAARGQGVLSDTGESYTSPARVLLLGMGADEQLGGYSRHRSAYQNGGKDGLLDELEMELLRISERNLGRDNRIVSDHGVAGRFPYLDERVVSFLSDLPLNIKMNLDLPRGLGEKLILRAAAHKIGLAKTAFEPKRAIQFGSRIAKMENRKEKATDKAVRL